MNKRTIGIIILGGAGLLFLLTRKSSAATPKVGTGGGGSITREPGAGISTGQAGLWAGREVISGIAKPAEFIPKVVVGGITGIGEGIGNIFSTIFGSNVGLITRTQLKAPTTRG